MNEMHLWKNLSIISSTDYKIFDVQLIEKQFTKDSRIATFTRIESSNWVNIIPITKSGNIVLVKQFRHGIEDFTYEFPGGLIEDEELASIAAMRECEEETGYSSESEAIFLGNSLPNPAFMNNVHSSFVWFDCHKIKSQNLDENEDIEIYEFSISEIMQMIKEGKFIHSLNLTALFYFLMKYPEYR